jgi:uncharacterized membrane protein
MLMKKQTIQSVFIFAHFCLMMIFLGGVFMENFISYPNWFHNIPTSLENTNNFYQVINPGAFFQTVFPLTILTGIGFVILGWKVKPVRNFILMSLLLLICTEALTVIFIYPLIGIMLREGTAAHSVDFLKQTAHEFVRANQLRIAFFIIAEALSFTGLWKFIGYKWNRAI